METTVLQAGDCKPPSGRKMKARAPPPPNQPPIACKSNNGHNLTTDLGMLPDQGAINMKENLISRMVDVTVIFPDGEEQNNTVQGSKAVMDLLVDLCSRHHLNPAHHTLELHSLGTQQPLNYKPNTLIGTLDVQKILLKEKVLEGKTKRPPPRIPEKTVRLVVNYLKTQKAVVRVSPEVPLQSIIPAICEKCEVSQEYLVLLRDTFSGEELELTKSLNELGIKELYAWDRKRETRNSSTSCDTTEKEKKRFLGFFKTNKRNSKAEEYLTTRMDEVCGSEEPFKSTTASEQSIDGITTTLNSPSVNSCSVTLGPSLSLGNISGMTGSTEIKKRRAPPPPMVIPQLQSGEPNGEEQMLSQMSQSSLQNELQKKKRRAPPPPTPTMPNRTEEMEDKRKSTVGNGRHVPQKPPRGNTRGSPQLVIPPPPPYPPPDTDTMDPTELYSEADVTDPTKLVPKRNLQLSHDIPSMDDVDLSEIEETTSVSSCFASEDTTEDSGVMSSLSDIVSLDSQNDSMRSREKSIGAQETLAEMDSMFVAESSSVRNSSFNSDGSGNSHQRDDDKMMEATFENTDVFIAAQLQQTLDALDEDLAAMEGLHDDSESRSVSSEMNGASSPLPQNDEAVQGVSLPVPVTIIDEVLEDDITVHSDREKGTPLFSMTDDNEDIPVHSISPGKLTNENSNTITFSKGYVDGECPYLSKSLLQQQSPKEEFGHQTEEEQKYEFETHTSSCEKMPKKDAALEIISKNEVDSEESSAKVIVSNVRLMNEVNGTKEKVRPLKEVNTNEGFPSKFKTELEFRHASAKARDEKDHAPPPSLWCHRVHNGVTNYEPKIGLTTFKVVPPKPEAKYFDRDASLSTGAIKIDELGNLVTPNVGGIRNVTVNTTSSETEKTVIERAKAYWRSSSMEKQLEESQVGYSAKPVIIPNSKPLSKISQTKPECLTSLKVETSPLVGSSAVGSNVGTEKTKPPVHVAQSLVKTLTAPVVNKDKVELPFQKPQRRTSSLYVASAIAKCIDPSQFKTYRERHDKGEEMSNEKGVNAETEPLPQRCTVTAKYCTVETQPTKTKESYSNTFNCSKNISHTLPLGAHSRLTNNTANIRSQNQTKPTNCSSEPFTTLSSKDCGIIRGDPSCGSIQNIIVREMPSVLNQMREQVDHTSPAFLLRSSNAHTSPITFSSSVNSSRGRPINSGSELNGTLTANHVVSEKDEKLGNAPRRNEPESDIKDDNLYNVFGPKKKFKPVIQKPLPKDTSLHSALMEAIQTAGGRENLRKISPSAINGGQKTPLFTEPENERSALLAAIRGHNGTSKLRKISSSASEELQSFRNAEGALQNRATSTTEQQCNPPPPPLPPTPAQLRTKTPRSFANRVTDNQVDARQALMEAIRSGSGAARLRKVPLLV
ncbi:protein cordon-bleu isoform X2 [Elgaria multicarinata webbii]|uniref:protein cordon-bleu isoform X2 n=1 Tax=Elgaria multicarinata webbii TaxID=159646 RepID=UPI002FCD57C8